MQYDSEGPGIDLGRKILRLKEVNTDEARARIRQTYRTDEVLAYKIRRALLPVKGDEDEQFELNAIERNQIADNTVVEKGGIIVSGAEVADENLELMAKATAAKWFCALEEMFVGAGVTEIPLHGNNGRVQIAIPGVHYGMEIGGILDWFNSQGMTVDIQAVDSRRAGVVGLPLHLEERTERLGSKAEFIQAGAENYFAGRQTDIVVLRHPGPIANVDQQGRWRQMIRVLAETEPAFMVLSTYNYPIVDPVAAGRIGREVTEAELLSGWLAEAGYIAVEGSTVENDDLSYPVNIYGLTENKGSEKRSSRPVDRYMKLFRKIE